MKLQELESRTQIQQNQKIFESYFGQKLDVDAISKKQAQSMLKKIRGLIREYRGTPEFHRSERNPSYLKLMVMEQALSAHVNEVAPALGVKQGAMAQQTPAQQAVIANADGDLARGVAKVAAATGQGGQSQRLTKAIQSTLAGKTPDSASRAALAQHMTGIAALEKDPNMSTRLQQMLKQASAQAAKGAVKENKKQARRLREANELQQAQVVLAAQDMVDQIQKMIEQVSSMQFKDLPALVDSIRNDVGMDQAQQFNNDCTAALQGLIQGLQGSKTQLETAQGVLTGQAPVVPGQDAAAIAAPAGAIPGAEGGEEIGADLGLDANLPAEEPEEIPAKSLGRSRR